MKVVHINATYGFGSTGLIVKDIGETLTREGHDNVFVYQKTNESLVNGYKVGNKLDWKMHAIKSRALGSQGFYSNCKTRKLCKFLFIVKPDVVHLHNLHSNYVNIEILFKFLAQNNIATVITMHDCWLFTGKCFHYADVNCDKFQYGCGNCPKIKEAPKSLFLDKTKRNLKNKIRLLKIIPKLQIVGCSNWICDEILKSELASCYISQIYNGVDIEIFKPLNKNELKKSYGFSNKKIIMGMANKWLLEQNKKLLELVVDNLSKDEIFLIVGCSKEQKDKLKKFQGKVVAFDFIKTRKELAEFYNIADVFANPTYADTLPTVNMESICCGTPVVTYNACGSGELICENTGLKVSVGMENKFVEAINIALNKQWDKCSEIGREKFNKNESYKAYINIYKALCEKNF